MMELREDDTEVKMTTAEDPEAKPKKGAAKKTAAKKPVAKKPAVKKKPAADEGDEEEEEEPVARGVFGKGDSLAAVLSSRAHFGAKRTVSSGISIESGFSLSETTSARALEEDCRRRARPR